MAYYNFNWHGRHLVEEFYGGEMKAVYKPWFLIEHRCFRRSICTQRGQSLSDQASGISGATTVNHFDLNVGLMLRLTFSVLETTVDSALGVQSVVSEHRVAFGKTAYHVDGWI